MADYDPYDTPPIWLRLVMLAICLLGCALISSWLASHGHTERAIVAAGGMLVAGSFIFTTSTGVKSSGVVIGYWTLLIILVLSTPQALK